MDKIGHAWEMVKASWNVLRKDRELLLFSLLSVLCYALLCLGFFRAMQSDIASGAFSENEIGSENLGTRVYFLLFLFYLVTYLVGDFFSTAVAACAVIRLRGGDPTVRDGLSTALNRLPVILGWAFFAATIGILLRMVVDRSKLLGRIVVGFLGITFSIASFLVIPILAIEGVGPIEAFRRSAALLKKTWGEQIAGIIGLSAIGFLASLPAIIFLIPGMIKDSISSLLIGLLLAAAYLALVMLIMQTLQTIYQAAVYLYAKDGQVPEGFTRELMEGAIVTK